LRQETGDRRQETGDRRQETGDRRQPVRINTESALSPIPVCSTRILSSLRFPPSAIDEASPIPPHLAGLRPVLAGPHDDVRFDFFLWSAVELAWMSVNVFGLSR